MSLTIGDGQLWARRRPWPRNRGNIAHLQNIMVSLAGQVQPCAKPSICIHPPYSIADLEQKEDDHTFLWYQPSEKPSVIVHIISSSCTMLMIMMTVWNVFSKRMTRIIITMLLQIEMWTWLKGRTVKLNLFASHKSCFSVWAPSISKRSSLVNTRATNTSTLMKTNHKLQVFVENNQTIKNTEIQTAQGNQKEEIQILWK